MSIDEQKLERRRTQLTEELLHIMETRDVDRECRWCGKSLEGRNRNTRYCDQRCRHPFREKYDLIWYDVAVSQSCAYCRALLDEGEGNRNGRKRYCSDVCAMRYIYYGEAYNHRHRQIGEKYNYRERLKKN